MRAVMALSGGMDSTGLLMRLLADGYKVSCISYEYGQKHNIELERAQSNISYLAENGYDVALLEAETIGSGGSGRNGGHLCQGWPNDFHHISNQLSAHDADLAWAAGMAAVDMVASRVRKHNIACDLQFGYLHAALHNRQLNELLAMQEEWSNRGYAHLTALTDRTALAPHINSQSYCGGLYDERSGQIQPLKYLMGLALAARVAGARF